MENRNNRAFVIAVVLHLVLFALLFTGYLLSPDRPPPEARPLELYSPPAEAQETPSEPEPDRRQARRLELPEFDFEEVEVPESRPRERPQPPEPEPAPPPEPRREEPAPEPEPERLTLDQFRAQHGAPPEPRSRPQPRPEPRRQVQAPRIQSPAEQLRALLEQESAIELSAPDLAQLSRASSADQSRMQNYFARLRAAIERAWSQPSGARRGTEATVRFSLAADGRITGARVALSSGNDEFDRSILQAFERLGSFDPPPDGESYTPTLTFRVDD